MVCVCSSTFLVIPFPLQELTLAEAVRHLCVFLNAYLSCRLDNRLAVIAAHTGKRCVKENRISLPSLVREAWLCMVSFMLCFWLR